MWLRSKFTDPIRNLLNRNDRFSRGILAILSGTIVSRLIAFMAIPLLSRLFTPTEFGVFALFGMITAMLATVVTWRFEPAIVLPKSDKLAVNLLGVCIGLTTTTSIAIAVLFYFYADSVSLFFGSPELEIWLYWSPLCIWAIGIFTSLRSWNSRTSDFKAISIASIADTSSMAIVQIGVGLLFRGLILGLMLGPFAARFTGMVVLLRSTIKSDGKLIRESMSLKVAMNQAIRYIRFPLYDLPATLLSTLSREMPTGILGIFFSIQWVGLYSIAYRILTVPVQILGRAIAQVYLPVAQDAKAANVLDRFTLSIFDRLLAISFAPMLMLAITAPQVISVLLGPEWYMAGEILRYLTPSLMMAFIASPLSDVYSVLERQPEKLIFNVAVAFTRFSALMVGGLLDDVLVAIILYSVSGTVLWILQCYWLLTMCGIKLNQILARISAEILKTIPFILFVGGIQFYYNDFSPRRVTLAFFVGLLVFTAWRWKEFLDSSTSRSNLTPKPTNS
jgi:lipopolysaccharide exporter